VRATAEAAPLLLFLHVPKTGGATLNSLVYANLKRGLRVDEIQQRSRVTELVTYVPEGVYHVHDGFETPVTEAETRAIRRAIAPDTAAAVLGHFSFGFHRIFARRSSYITILRDPVDRLASLYSHLVRYEQEAYGVSSRMLGAGAFGSEPAVANDQIRRVSGLEPHDTRPSRILAEAKRILRKHFALVGLTERFDELVILLKRRLAWEQVCYLPRHVNTRPETQRLLPSEREAIEKANALDIEFYGYVRELFERQVQEEGSSFRSEVEAFRAANDQYIESHGWTRVDVNTASRDELRVLPGVGPAIAQRIIERRERVGPFRSVDELFAIRGIGPVRRWKILDRVVP
jgi:competence ComEA-like helix-hairpin-helix protein